MDIKIIDAKKTILEDNDEDAEVLRKDLEEKGILYLNVMSSPGSGKTSCIISIIKRLESDFRIAVMEADIDSDVDARKIQEETGAEAIQIHTGGMCHLDAEMSRQGLRELKSSPNLVILENVGNLVCPAEFDTGAAKNIVILSVPEGDDKPLKYPLMFEKADAVVINKIDAIEAFDFNIERARENIKKRNGSIPVFPVSAATGEGVDEITDWIKKLSKNY
ncbi:MAG: hydrogenase nickel incorporation protein HypB [Lachnospiraceae bacterium]|nr:hydrogenase nickel incorporation protein HypB [Lachnospiraceae bacterium]